MQSACAVLYCNLRHVWLYHYFPTLSHNQHDFRKRIWQKNMFWFSLQILSETFLILRRIQRDTVITYTRLHVKYPLFSPHFNQTEFSRKPQIPKRNQIPSNRSRTVSFGRTDTHDEVHSRFFANAPEYSMLFSQYLRCLSLEVTNLSTKQGLV